jgi:hypothetical protein
MIRFLGIPLLVVASVLALAACNGKSSSNAAEQSSAAASTAAEATPAAPSPAPSGPAMVYGVLVFPGAMVRPPSAVNMGGAKTTVLSVDEPYDQVTRWYDARNPGVPQTPLSGPMNSDVFTIGTGKNTVTVTVSDTPDHQNTLITYVRGKV